MPPLAIRGSRAPLTAVAASLAAAAGAALLPPPARAGPHGDAARIEAGLRRAVITGRIGAPDADRYHASLRRAVSALPALGQPGRRQLCVVLHGIALRSHRLAEPQALVLFSTLEVNARHLPRGVPPAGAEVVGADGIVYRAFPGIGLRFHPLESFGRLNAHASSGRPLRAYRLAYALLARATPEGETLLWRYEFDASGQRAPWTSGMTQAVAAQALARVGLVRDARRAFRALPAGHLLRLERGPWVRLYRASRMAVLNAQLQAAISVAEYARRARDAHALRLARALSRTAAGLLPEFDTGYWSRYALGGNEAPLEYHRYVVSLLWKLARSTDRPLWQRYAARFRSDWRRPPRLRPLGRARPVFPIPADGHRDRAAIRFWLSKPATVTLFVAGQRVTARLQPGRRSFEWRPRGRPPGRYHVRVVAVDRVGNRTDRDLPPVVVERDRTPPRVVVRRRGGRLVWKPVDAGSGWVEGCLVLRLGDVTLPRALGQVPSGLEAALPAPTLRPRTTLVVRDAAGNATTLPLAGLEPAAGSFLRRRSARIRLVGRRAWSPPAAPAACTAPAAG